MADANIFKYPSDIDSVDSAYMIISAYPYHLKLQKNSYFEPEASNIKKYAFHFVSYVPKDLKYSNAPKYENVRGLAITEAITTLINSKDNDNNRVSQLWGQAGLEGIVAIGKEFAKGTLEALGVDDLAKIALDQASLGSGLWSDPRLLNVYKEPNNVSQSFTFTMLANSQQEAKDILKAVLCFKYAAQPQRAGTQFVEGLSEAIPVLHSPLNFDITIMIPDGSNNSTDGYMNMTPYSLVREYLYMNLTNIDAKPITDTSRVDVPYYVDGNAIGYELTLRFSSMHPVILPNDISDSSEVNDAIRIVNGNSSYAYNGVQSEFNIRPKKIP